MEKNHNKIKEYGNRKANEKSGYFRKNIGKIFTSGFVVIFFAILFVIFSLRGIVNVYKLKSKEKNLENKISLIKKENKKTERQIYKLQYNKQYIANIAREKLNMIKKGELVFKFLPKK